MYKTILTFLCLSILVNFTNAQSYSELISEADRLYSEKEYEASADKFQEAFKIEAKNSSHLYNGACSAALAGKDEIALNLLNQSVENGWTNARHLKSDSDLNSLHGTNKFEEIAAKSQKNLDKIEANYNKPLQAELLAIYKDDQEIRKEYMAVAKELGWGHPKTDSLGKIMGAKDEVNLILIKKILKEHGWVGTDIVGGQANATLFLVIQHADLETQQEYLPMMREAVEKGNARGSSLALLEDRIALREGRKQIYGSQIGRVPDSEDSYVLPLKDPGNVDKRREKVGLGPLAEYANRFGVKWDVEEYKKNLPKYVEWNKK